jgi:chemotaxis protein methyltransferase CheR
VLKVPAPLRQQYFVKRNGSDGKVEYEVSAALKKIITFRRLNLKEPYPFKGPFDYIFCRNVMIYFDKQTQESLVQKMSGYLAPGGYLFVGHSESLTGLTHPLRYVRPAVYRK